MAHCEDGREILSAVSRASRSLVTSCSVLYHCIIRLTGTCIAAALLAKSPVLKTIYSAP